MPVTGPKKTSGKPGTEPSTDKENKNNKLEQKTSELCAEIASRAMAEAAAKDAAGSSTPGSNLDGGGQYRGWSKKAARRSETATVELSRFVRSIGDLKTLNYTVPADRKRGLGIVLGMEREKLAWGRRFRFPAGQFYVEAGQEPWTSSLMRVKALLVPDWDTLPDDAVYKYYSAVRDAAGLLRDNEYIIDQASVEWKLHLKWIPNEPRGD